MKLELWHGADRSIVRAGDIAIEYGRRIHRQEPAADYQTIATELATYGADAAIAVAQHMAATRT